jgi:glycosyltransferase involved in cell wall biosynthesis
MSGRDDLPMTVASRALQRRYGGTWIPHIRDRRDFAERASTGGPALRRRLGIDSTAVIGFIGTPRAHKGLTTAARAVAALPEECVLLIGGDINGQARKQLAAIASWRLRITGPLPLQDVPALLGACDVVLVPQGHGLESEYQSPAKLFDAMAAGAAIVASDVGDVREVMGDAGVLVPPDNPSALRDAIAHLLSSDAIRQRFGAVAEERYRAEFDLERWRQRMAGVIYTARDRISRAVVTS